MRLKSETMHMIVWSEMSVMWRSRNETPATWWSGNETQGVANLGL